MCSYSVTQAMCYGDAPHVLKDNEMYNEPLESINQKEHKGKWDQTQ